MDDDTRPSDDHVERRPGAATTVGALDILLGGLALAWGLFRIVKSFDPDVGGILYGILNIPACVIGGLGVIAGVGLLGEKKWGITASNVFALACLAVNIAMFVAVLSTEQSLGQVIARHVVVGAVYPAIALLLAALPAVREFYAIKGE